jgi:hypothetical protein
MRRGFGDTGGVRTPSHRRSQRRSACQLPEGRDLSDLISGVRYVGSTEHKSYPSAAGQPALRSDATPCDHRIGTFEDFEEWLRQGIADGRIGAPWEGSPGYPRYVWFEMTGVCYEGRLVNRVLGQYKGYGLTGSERRDLHLQMGWK